MKKIKIKDDDFETLENERYLKVAKKSIKGNIPPKNEDIKIEYCGWVWNGVIYHKNKNYCYIYIY